MDTRMLCILIWKKINLWLQVKKNAATRGTNLPHFKSCSASIDFSCNTRQNSSTAVWPPQAWPQSTTRWFVLEPSQGNRHSGSNFDPLISIPPHELPFGIIPDCIVTNAWLSKDAEYPDSERKATYHVLSVEPACTAVENMAHGSGLPSRLPGWCATSALMIRCKLFDFSRNTIGSAVQMAVDATELSTASRKISSKNATLQLLVGPMVFSMWIPNLT